jgi:hypothetical protein
MAVDPTVTQNAAAASGTAGGEMFAGLSLISTLFGAWSSHEAGKKNRQLMEYNAGIAELQADDAIKRGTVASNRRRVQTRQTIGAQRAELAHQGVDINDVDSSAADVQADAAYLGELDAVTIQNNAAREAWGYRMQAQDLTLRGRYAQQTGDMQGVQTLLTGGSTYLLRKYGFGTSPEPPPPSDPATRAGLDYLDRRSR